MSVNIALIFLINSIKMKKIYVSPRIFVEKMGVSLLIQTSTIPVNTKEPKELDSKEYFGGIDTDDADED